MSTMLDDMKTLLGITGDSKDAILTLVLEQTEAKVLANIHQMNLPNRAKTLVTEMATDAYRLLVQGNGENAGSITGAVSSISDNGQTVGYRENAYASVLETVSDGFIKDYESRLAPYRRAGW